MDIDLALTADPKTNGGLLSFFVLTYRVTAKLQRRQTLSQKRHHPAGSYTGVV